MTVDKAHLRCFLFLDMVGFSHWFAEDADELLVVLRQRAFGWLGRYGSGGDA